MAITSVRHLIQLPDKEQMKKEEAKLKLLSKQSQNQLPSQATAQPQTQAGFKPPWTSSPLASPASSRTSMPSPPAPAATATKPTASSTFSKDVLKEFVSNKTLQQSDKKLSAPKPSTSTSNTSAATFNMIDDQKDIDDLLNGLDEDSIFGDF